MKKLLLSVMCLASLATPSIYSFVDYVVDNPKGWQSHGIDDVIGVALAIDGRGKIQQVIIATDKRGNLPKQKQATLRVGKNFGGTNVDKETNISVFSSR